MLPTVGGAGTGSRRTICGGDASFAGRGAVCDWGVVASLIETCKLNAVDLQAFLASTLARLINRHPASQIDPLMPWAYHQVP